MAVTHCQWRRRELLGTWETAGLWSHQSDPQQTKRTQERTMCWLIDWCEKESVIHGKKWWIKNQQLQMFYKCPILIRWLSKLLFFSNLWAQLKSESDICDIDLVWGGYQVDGFHAGQRLTPLAYVFYNWRAKENSNQQLSIYKNITELNVYTESLYNGMQLSLCYLMMHSLVNWLETEDNVEVS